ncbi:MAG: pyruvate formate-lyase, partial [Lentisphaerae bacterium]|nr:pyruvate formate-lyase [Lentisphaerota bacterium]
KNITERPPANLREAMQLMWVYCLVSYMDNYGRMDVYLGDFYARDIDEGVLTEEEASRLITALWQLIADLADEGKLGAAAQGRIVVGGAGRRNEENADRFALAALEVSRRMRVTEPNTTLRFCEGQTPALMTKALEMIGEGCIHPALYNDAVNVPALQKTYGASREDAEQYLPVGCGEFCLEAKSLNSPNGQMSYLAALDLVLHNGRDISTGAQAGLALGGPDDFPDFDSLVGAVKRQISHTHRLLALRHGFEIRAERKDAPFLFMSILNGACIARGKSILDGGIDYLGGMIETYGLTSLADSLTAIKTLVYETKEMSLRKLVRVLDHDFAGFESERQRMLRLPKYGNDVAEVDDLLVQLGAFICRDVLSHAAEAGLNYFTICSMNPGGFQFSRITAASADGRRKGDPMPIGNAPTQGRDTSGPTALLNSMAKPLNMHGGFVQNLKLAPTMFSTETQPKLEALLRTYFGAGGAQIMITCINQADLQDALDHPEKHENLVVRVGGWTSRYVALPKDIQIAILNRTLHA